MKSLSLSLIFIFIICVPAFSFSFAVIGDNQGYDEPFRTILAMIKKDRSIDFAVNNGDITSIASALEYDKYADALAGSGVIMYNAIGNHDVQYRGRSLFRKYFGSTFYSWDHKGSHFIVLDNVRYKGLGSDQYQWLLKDLKDNKGKMKFVFAHMPLFNITGSFPEEVMRPKVQALELMRLFQKNNVKIVFCGHVHGYSKQVEGGIVYILSAGAGAPSYLPVFSGGFHNFVKITVEDGKIKDEVIRVE